MRRSKLEIQVRILTALAHYGPLKLTHIMYKANVNCSVLNQCLDLLVQHQLVDERSSKRSSIYAITKNGRKVVEIFARIDKALMITEDSKRLHVANTFM